MKTKQISWRKYIRIARNAQTRRVKAFLRNELSLDVLHDAYVLHDYVYGKKFCPTLNGIRIIYTRTEMKDGVITLPDVDRRII